MTVPTSMRSRDDAYIHEVREAVKKLWDGMHTLVMLQTEWNALDYLNTLAPTERYGYNQYTPADIGAAVFDTANAVKALLDGGHKTNLAKLL